MPTKTERFSREKAQKTQNGKAVSERRRLQVAGYKFAAAREGAIADGKATRRLDIAADWKVRAPKLVGGLQTSSEMVEQKASAKAATLSGLRGISGAETQGSACGATLGWRMQSRWDWELVRLHER